MTHPRTLLPWLGLLLAVGCAASSDAAAEADLAPSQSEISLIEMEPGDRVTGRIHSSGCFYSSTYELEVVRGERWHVRLTERSASIPTEAPATRSFELGSAEVLELDRELSDTRVVPELASTSTRTYSLTWERGEETLAVEKLVDGTGGGLNRGHLTFLSLFEREPSDPAPAER